MVVICIYVQTFADFFGFKSSLQVEAQALLLGFSICDKLTLHDLIVECDSNLLILSANGRAKIAWNLKKDLQIDQ